jgi:outer membrane protein assembly factor BamD (BamD/ComL family)
MPALDAELALLRAAREALGRKAPAAALASLDQHAREFPGGHLVEERMLLRAQAQCELGRREAARAAAAELVRAFPESPHARTVAGLCAD